MEVTPHETLAEVARSRPASVRVFESFGLDYCCRGRRTIEKACEITGVELSKVMDALATVDATSDLDWAALSAVELVDAIEATHHAYLHGELGRLGALAKKVASKHATTHPELTDVRETFDELRADLEPHLAKEERVVFPMIRAMAANSEGAASRASLDVPISVLLKEHDRTGELLVRLRELTNGYQSPADGCNSYRALYDGLNALELDTHLHIHREDNILFPAVVDLESLASVTE